MQCRNSNYGNKGNQDQVLTQCTDLGTGDKVPRIPGIQESSSPPGQLGIPSYLVHFSGP